MRFMVWRGVKECSNFAFFAQIPPQEIAKVILDHMSDDDRIDALMSHMRRFRTWMNVIGVTTLMTCDVTTLSTTTTIVAMNEISLRPAPKLMLLSLMETSAFSWPHELFSAKTGQHQQVLCDCTWKTYYNNISWNLVGDWIR